MRFVKSYTEVIRSQHNSELAIHAQFIESRSERSRGVSPLCISSSAAKLNEFAKDEGESEDGLGFGIIDDSQRSGESEAATKKSPVQKYQSCSFNGLN